MNKIRPIAYRPLRILFCITLALIIGPGAGMAAAIRAEVCGMDCCGSVGSEKTASMMSMETGCCDNMPVSSCDQLPDDAPPLLATVTGRSLSTPDGTGSVECVSAAPIREIETDGTLLIRNRVVPAFHSPPLYLSNASFLI